MIDGVLADMESELVRQARLLFGDILRPRASVTSADTDPSADRLLLIHPCPACPACSLDMSERRQRAASGGMSNRSRVLGKR